MLLVLLLQKDKKTQRLQTPSLGLMYAEPALLRAPETTARASSTAPAQAASPESTKHGSGSLIEPALVLPPEPLRVLVEVDPPPDRPVQRLGRRRVLFPGRARGGGARLAGVGLEHEREELECIALELETLDDQLELRGDVERTGQG